MKKSHSLLRSISAAPHIFWSILFIVLPLVIVVFYAFTDADGRIYIRFANEFAISRVNKPEVKDALRAAMCLVLQRNIADADISFGVFVGDEDKISDLDEFNID